ncbi:MAG: type II secretion system protein [Planctomycetota bacterium]
MKRRQTRGFTLIETIAAIVILAMAIPPIFWALRDGATRRVGALQASQARWHATDKLEDIIADRHSTTRGYDYVITGNYAAESPIAGANAFSRTVSISETAADLVTVGTGYKTVTVTVSWTDLLGTSNDLAVSTVVTDFQP